MSLYGGISTVSPDETPPCSVRCGSVTCGAVLSHWMQYYPKRPSAIMYTGEGFPRHLNELSTGDIPVQGSEGHQRPLKRKER